MHPYLDSFEQNVARIPTQLAACDASLELDYQSLRAVACGFAARLREQAESPRVAILAPTSSACAAAILGCWYAGKTPVPLNFLSPPEEIALVLKDADVDLVVTIERFAPAVAQTGLKTLLLSAETLTPGRVVAPDAELSDTAVILYTSGTTGTPKGVELSFDNILSNCRRSAEHARLGSGHVFLGVIPQFHGFGFTALTALPLLSGGTVHYLARFMPTKVVELVREKQVTVFVAVASMYGALAKMKDADPDAFRSVEYPITGGEALPASIARAFQERFGVTLLEGYGMTETSPIVSLNTPTSQRAGSVGRALPGVTVEAVDAQGRAVAPGEEGELIVRGHCVMQRYRHRPEETAAVLKEGALRTGDLGRVDADGFIFITGRVKELIIVGGENVHPCEIESKLVEHPAVAEAAVIGAPDEVRGEAPVAFVVLKEGLQATESELRQFCRDRLPGYKTPRQIRIETDLPHGATGKVLKRALRP